MIETSTATVAHDTTLSLFAEDDSTEIPSAQPAEQTRTFSVSPSIITHLIQSQAGSLGKAIAECVMNSVDAGATRIDIMLDRKSIMLADNGHGFRSRAEILECFEVFGFDHRDGGGRVYGKFGLGRGQLWNYAPTTWLTNAFRMDVDVRERGLDYTLVENLSTSVEGLVIHGNLYEPLSNVELAQAESEITRLCRYCRVETTLNGKTISLDPSVEKWTAETDDAWIRITEGSELKVYNQGIFVSALYMGNTGIAGVLVTKPGVNLDLNMARNDVLRSKCAVWKRLQKVLEKHARDALTSRTQRLTDAQRDYLARASSEPAEWRVLEENIFTLCNGRNISLPQIIRAMGNSRVGQELTVAPMGDSTGEVLIKEKAAIVLAPVSLERFGVASVIDLFDLVTARYLAGREAYEGSRAGYLRKFFDEIRPRVRNDIMSCTDFRRLQYSVIPKDSLSAHEKALLSVLESQDYYIRRAIRQASTASADREAPHRKLCMGEGTDAEAFTDGKTFIAINRKVAMTHAGKGLAGFLAVANLILHEYLHDEDTAGSHTHDHEFYEAFHDVAIDGGSELYAFATSALKLWAGRTGRLSKRIAADLDRVESGSTGDAQ